MGHGGLHSVCERYNWLCYHCGRRLHCALCHPGADGPPATRDHLVPRSKGGRGAGNLVPSCSPCNQRKADLLPGEAKPRKPPTKGCHGNRKGAAARRRRPFKQFPTHALADAMVVAVYETTGKRLAPWHCPHCDQWHVALRRDQRPDGIGTESCTMAADTP